MDPGTVVEAEVLCCRKGARLVGEVIQTLRWTFAASSVGAITPPCPSDLAVRTRVPPCIWVPARTNGGLMVGGKRPR
jgi:hypothetical protein